MTRQDLKKYLETEMARWEGRPFREVIGLKYPLVYESGVKGQSAYYSTEVTMLEKDSKQIHLCISIDDGGISAFVPVSATVIIEADGQLSH